MDKNEFFPFILPSRRPSTLELNCSVVNSADHQEGQSINTTYHIGYDKKTTTIFREVISCTFYICYSGCIWNLLRARKLKRILSSIEFLDSLPCSHNKSVKQRCWEGKWFCFVFCFPCFKNRAQDVQKLKPIPYISLKYCKMFHKCHNAVNHYLGIL